MATTSTLPTVVNNGATGTTGTAGTGHNQHGLLPHTAEKPARVDNNHGHHGHTTDQSVGPYGQGFHFMTWIRLHLLDLITMAAMGAVGLGVYFARPAPTRSFPIFTNGSHDVVYPQFAYPLRKNIIPIVAAALLAFFVPFVFFVLFQIKIRSPHHLLGSTMGLLESLITAAVFQVFCKWLIGGLRPHFLAVCKPDMARVMVQQQLLGVGFANYMFDRNICTGDEKDINDALESWMSGHSTAAFAGFIYLFFWLNAQLKVMSDHRPAYWKMILTIAPILGATLIAASLTIDEFHNWYDCVSGALTGTLCAIIAYRKTFASWFDFRFNHILLPRSAALFHRTPVGGAAFRYSAQEAAEQKPATREGGWGSGNFVAGAPGDATALGGAGGAMGAAAQQVPGRQSTATMV